MQVDAIYREGRIQFATPIRLKNHPIRVRIDIPDDEVDRSNEQPDTPASAQPSDASAAPGFVDQLRGIQALVRAQLQSPANRPLSKEDIRDLRAQAWEDKQRG